MILPVLLSTTASGVPPTWEATDGIEKKAYDRANGFLGRYNKGFTSPAGERHMLEQVYEYLRGNLKLTKIEP